MIIDDKGKKNYLNEKQVWFAIMTEDCEFASSAQSILSKLTKTTAPSTRRKRIKPKPMRRSSSKLDLAGGTLAR